MKQFFLRGCRIHFGGLIGLMLVLIVVTAGCDSGRLTKITNPYEGVNWATHKQHKADFHAHTNQSDGKWSPEKVIQTYADLNFKVLALTDHDKVTFPLSSFGKNPAEMGMVAIQGCELSLHHHMVSLFGDINSTCTEEDALLKIGAKGGLAIFAHPYRTSKKSEWYLPFFKEYDHLVGIEMVNPAHWDYCLTHLMPDRPVWGFANSDSHGGSDTSGAYDRIKAYDYVWSVLLLPVLSEGHVYAALTRGEFYSCLRGTDEPPAIQSVNVDQRRGTISISSPDSSTVSWIANGKVVAEGLMIDCRKLPLDATYVRAELVSAGGSKTRTNPFGLVRSRQIEARPKQTQAHWAARHEKVCREAIEARQVNWADAYPNVSTAGASKWRPADLTSVANRPLTGSEGWLGKRLRGPWGNLRQIKAGCHIIHGVPFDVIDQEKNLQRASICLLSTTFPDSLGKPNPPSVSIPLPAKCKAVYVLHGASYVGRHAKIGRYSLIYADGTEEGIDIVDLGHNSTDARRLAKSNIQDWWPNAEQFNALHSKKVIVSTNESPLDIRYLYTLELINSHPQKELKALRLASEPGSKAGLMILAVTAQALE